MYAQRGEAGRASNNTSSPIGRAKSARICAEAGEGH